MLFASRNNHVVYLWRQCSCSGGGSSKPLVANTLCPLCDRLLMACGTASAPARMPANFTLAHITIARQKSGSPMCPKNAAM